MISLTYGHIPVLELAGQIDDRNTHHTFNNTQSQTCRNSTRPYSHINTIYSLQRKQINHVTVEGNGGPSFHHEISSGVLGARHGTGLHITPHYIHHTLHTTPTPTPRHPQHSTAQHCTTVSLHFTGLKSFGLSASSDYLSQVNPLTQYATMAPQFSPQEQHLMTVMKGNKKTPVQIHAHLVARRKGIAKRLSEPSRFRGKCMVNPHKPHALPGKCCSNFKE